MQNKNEILEMAVADIGKASFLPPDENYMLPARSFGGYVFDVDSESVSTAVQVAHASSGEVFLSYCLDSATYVNRSQNYLLATESQVAEVFDPALLKKIRWMINHSFPFIDDLAKLDSMCGSSGLTQVEAVAASQAAIWSLTNPSTFRMGDETNGNSPNIMALYNYLMNNCVPWETEDVTRLGEGASIVFDSLLDQYSFDGEKYMYGPIWLLANTEAADDLSASLTLNNDAFELCDQYGNPISLVKPGEHFYLRTLKHIEAGEVCITAQGEFFYGVDTQMLICVDGKDASQTVGLVYDMSVLLEAEFCLSLSKLILKKTGERDCEEPLDGAVFELYAMSSAFLDEQTTDEAGIIYFYNLLPGEYNLRETQPPQGYELPEDEFWVNVALQTRVFCVKNLKKKCKIRVIKVDADHPEERLQDAVFDIRDRKGRSVGVIVTGRDGVGHSKPLSSGVYFLVEIKAPTGYALDREPKKVVLACDPNKPNTTVYVRNAKKKKNCCKPACCCAGQRCRTGGCRCSCSCGGSCHRSDHDRPCANTCSCGNGN